MTLSTRQHSRNGRWGIVQAIVSAIILFLLYRYLLNQLGVEKLGLWSLILASIALARIGELGFANATLRYVGKYFGAGDGDAAAAVVETSVISIAFPLGFLIIAAIPLLEVALTWLVPVRHHEDALRILPLAILALWLSIVSGIVQAALDGLGRMDRRQQVLIAGNVLYLVLALVLVPEFGLTGVALAQATQAAAVLLTTWVMAKSWLPSLPWVPHRWQKTRLREMVKLAVGMQVGGIAGILMEPVTKALLSRFGGLEFLGYYEMANQVITRARSVLITGFQAIVPQFAMTADPAAHQALFRESQRKVIELGLPYMTLVMIAYPLLSLIWIGRNEAVFVMAGQLVGLTWLIVTLLMPAYFYLAGTGQSAGIAAGQSMALAGTVVLGWACAEIVGGYGPIIGAGTALVGGNIYMFLISMHRLFPISKSIFLPGMINRKSILLGAVCGLIIVGNLVASHFEKALVGRLVLFALLSSVLVMTAWHCRGKASMES